MKFTTQLALQSQGTRLVESAPYVQVCKAKTGFSPSLMLFSKRLNPAPVLATLLETTIQWLMPLIFILSSSLFIRHY